MGATLKKYIWIAGLFFTVVTSYLLAKMTTLFIEGYFPDAVITAPQKTTAVSTLSKGAKDVDIDAIIKRNFFDPTQAVIQGDVEVPIEESDDKTDKTVDLQSDIAVETTLSIKLISTISVGNGENPYSSAVIKGARKTATYTLKSKERDTHTH